MCEEAGETNPTGLLQTNAGIRRTPMSIADWFQYKTDPEGVTAIDFKKGSGDIFTKILMVKNKLMYSDTHYIEFFFG